MNKERVGEAVRGALCVVEARGTLEMDEVETNGDQKNRMISDTRGRSMAGRVGWPSHFKVAAEQNHRELEERLQVATELPLLCRPCRRGRVTCFLQVPVS